MRAAAPTPLMPLLAAMLLLAPPPAAATEEGDAAAVEAPARSTELARRPDERRRETTRMVDLFGQRVGVAGEYEASHQSRRNLDFDPRRHRDRGRLDQELKLEASLFPSPRTTVFLQVVGVSEFETLRENGPLRSRGALERGQTWLFVQRPGDWPLDLQLGRLSLVEPRSWWWDDDLDAARLFITGEDWLVETGIGQPLLPVSTEERGTIDPEDEKVRRWFGRAAWAWRPRHRLEGFWLVARDGSDRAAAGTELAAHRTDESDADLDWIGLRVSGEARSAAGHRIGYWADYAQVAGREHRTSFDDGPDGHAVAAGSTAHRVRGYGWDLGARWSLPGAARPTLWAGWAVGSGDSAPDRGSDRAFRQTGLEENKGRFGGVKRFRYYGELMRPTLSNLAIRSVGASLRFWTKSSVDLVLHDYRQRTASDRLADSRLDQAPTGERRGLGQELDLFVAFRESPQVEFTFSLGTFRAGPAFGIHSGERAWFLEVGTTINF